MHWKGCKVCCGKKGGHYVRKKGKKQYIPKGEQRKLGIVMVAFKKKLAKARKKGAKVSDLTK